MTGKVEEGAQPGPKHYLNDEEKEELASFLVQTAKIGYLHTNSQVLALVQQIVDSKVMKDISSNGWWERFVHSFHYGLQYDCLYQAMATDAGVLGTCFIYWKIARLKCHFRQGWCDFNCDETGLPMNPKCAMVVDRGGTKNPSFVAGGDKSQVTVLACTSATCYALPQAMTKGEVPGTFLTVGG